MAKGKNVKNNIDNEFDFNSNLDFQDLAFDVDPFKDDRKPVTKVKDGLIKGIKSRSVNGQFIRGILKDILPKGFGQTLDLSDSIATNARQLYNESLNEVKPAINDFKRVSSKLIPANTKYVPDGIQKLLNKWKEEAKHKGSGDLDARAQRDNTIAMQLGEVFKEQAIADEKKTRQAQANDKIREGIEIGRHRDMFAVLNHSAMSLSGMYQYQTTINLKYQKKSLELQHRQLFSLYDIVDSLSKTHALQSDAFNKIVKNTGLPDWQKIKFKELAKQDLVSRVLEAKNKAVKGMFPNADEYLQMTARKIRDKTMGGIKANIQAFRSGLTEAESGAEMMKGSSGPSGLETGAEFVGDTATGALGEKLAKKIKGPLKDFIPALVKASDYLENFNENFVDTLEKFRKSKRWEGETGMKGFLIRGAQSMLPTISMDRTFTKISAKDLGDEKPFTLRTDRSINEIIPGYLSRILQEMQIQRTGNPNIDLVDYDQDKGKFVSSTKILKSISRDLFPEAETQRTKEIFDKILSGIDPKNELDQQQRDELSKALFKNKLEVKEPYTGLTGKSGRLTRSYLTGLEDKPEDKLVFSRQLNSLVRGASDPRTKIESYIEQGRQNELLKLGVISRAEDSYTLNVDALFSGKLGQDPFEAYQASKRKKARSDGLRPTGAASSNTLTDNVDKAISDKCNCESYFVDIIHRLDTSIDYYQSIQEIIKTGLNVTVKRGVGRQAVTSGAAAATESVKKTGKAVQDKILDAFSDYKQKSGGMSGAGIMGNLASLISVAVNPLSLPSKMTGGMSDKVMEMATDKALSTAADIIKKKYFNDDPSTTWNGIYVEGEDEPRITSKKLNAGYYASVIMGEVITSPKDINGPIKNVETGEIVISTEELDKLLIRTNDNKLRPLKDFIKRPSGLGSKNNKELYDWLLNKTKQRADAGATALWNRAIKEFEPIKKALTEEAQDVWVAGEKYPRMTATRRHRGHYQDAKTGKIIYLPSEITGEVKDNTGKTVISEEEIGSLLVWDSGKKKFAPIRKILRAVDKIAGGLTWYYTKIGIPLTKFNFRMIAKTAKLAGNVLRMSMGKGPLSVKDVYVGNEEKPRLYAVRIRNGDYYNKSDGKPIFHQDDINGEIVNSDGVVVLSDDDLENLRVYDSILKLFNPLRPLKWIMKTAGKAAAWTLKKGLAVTKFLTRKLGTGAMKMATGFIRYISKPEDVYVRGETFPRLRAVLFKAGRYVSEKTGLTIFLPSDIDGPVWDEQEKIRVLDNGDLQKGLVKEDGTPFKTTMLQNILKGIKTVNKLFSRRIKFTAKDTPIPNKELDLNKDTTGQETVSLLGDIKNIFEDYFTENKVKGDTDGDGDREGSWEDIKAKRETDKAKQQSNKPGEKTKDKEGKGGLMGILSSALEAITGMLGGITSLFKGGGVLGGLGKLLGVGRAAGAVAAAAGGMGTLGTIGAGIAAVVSSPVTLGIVGSAVVGYGAYKGYKALRKWMSKPTTLELIRYTQYGFKKEDTSYFSKVVDLEEYVKGFVKVGTDQAEIDEKKMDIEEMMSIFGFSAKDNDHKTQFGTWYIKRFKPVYLTHVSALNILNGSIDLTKVNDLKKELKLKYIEATKFSSGPYTVGTLPILGGKVAASTAADVSMAIETALKEFATAPGAAKKDSSGLYTDGRKPQDLASKGGRMDLGKPDATGKVPGSSVSGASSVGAGNLSSTVSAFDLVRFKTYGLKELEVSKIVSLTMLEMQMSKVIKFQGTKASFEGNPNELLEKVTTYFGIPDLFSDQAIAWGRWFRDRFLPVYLNYATLHMRAVNKAPKADGVPVLEANQQYDVALAVSSTSNVWRMTDTPWQGYELNINPETIKGNLEYLKDAAKQKTVRDQEAKAAENKNATALPEKKSYSAFVAKTPEYNPPTSGSVPTDAQRSKSFSDSLTKNANYVMPERAQGSIGPEPSTIAQGSLLEYIGKKESGGNYNVLVGGKTEPDLTRLTVREVLDYQKGMKGRGHESTAVGKYQIIRKTLEGLVQAGYASMDDVFSPQTQDKLALGLLKIRGLDSFLSGKMSKDEFADNLSKEWASLPYRTGGSYYDGVGSNKSSGSREEFVRLVHPNNIGTPGITTAAYTPDQPSKGAIVTAAYNEAPKSAYNPVARPVVKQQQAVQASKQAFSSPLSDAVGYNPRTAGTVTEANNASKNTLTADIMKNTESILAQSLSVHKETLDIMKMIYEKINSVGSTETPKSEARKYEAPMAPVPMRKSA